jgi:hypothetical protein
MDDEPPTGEEKNEETQPKDNAQVTNEFGATAGCHFKGFYRALRQCTIENAILRLFLGAAARFLVDCCGAMALSGRLMSLFGLSNAASIVDPVVSAPK